MDERRLVQIGESARCGAENGDATEMTRVCACDVPALIAEIRRLRPLRPVQGPGRSKHERKQMIENDAQIKRDAADRATYQAAAIGADCPRCADHRAARERDDRAWRAHGGGYVGAFADSHDVCWLCDGTGYVRGVRA